MNHPLFYATIMLISGIGIPIMATLNAGLSAKLQSTVLATTILLFVGLLISGSVLLIFQGIPKTLYVNGTPWYYYISAIAFFIYIMSVSWIAPKFGTANTIAFVLLGQMIAMTTIDHFALFGAHEYKISLQRVLGLLMMAAGVFMVLGKKSV